MLAKAAGGKSGAGSNYSDEDYQSLLKVVGQKPDLAWLLDVLQANVGKTFKPDTAIDPTFCALLKEACARTASYLIAAAASDDVINLVRLLGEGAAITIAHVLVLRQVAPLLATSLEAAGVISRDGGDGRYFPPALAPIVLSFAQRARSFWDAVAGRGPEMGSVEVRGPEMDFLEGGVFAASLQRQRRALTDFFFKQDLVTNAQRNAKAKAKAKRRAVPREATASAAAAAAAAATPGAKPPDDLDSGCHAATPVAHTLSPGLCTVMCEHGILYGMWFMADYESPRTLFEFIVSRFEVRVTCVILPNLPRYNTLTPPYPIPPSRSRRVK